MKKITKFVIFFLAIFLVGGLGYYLFIAADGLHNPLTYRQEVLLDVPYANQLEDNPLKNGCEVTSLSMLLRYYGFHETKNDLAAQIDRQPFLVDATHHGDPRKGFVGNITDGYAAMGVYVEPISKLCRQIVGTKYQVHSGENLPPADLKRLIHHEKPVWILTTLDFQPVTKNDLLKWKTPSGTMTVSPLIHSVVVTGIDQHYFYVNDPLKKKDRKVPINKLLRSFTGMRAQYLYLSKK